MPIEISSPLGACTWLWQEMQWAEVANRKWLEGMRGTSAGFSPDASVPCACTIATLPATTSAPQMINVVPYLRITCMCRNSSQRRRVSNAPVLASTQAMALSVFSSSFAGGNVPRSSKLLSAIAALFGLALFPSLAMAAASEPEKQSLDGKPLFTENCAACHGADGRGDRKLSDLGFAAFNAKMPDFSDCGFANREADGDWASTIHRGGRARAFPRAMPAWDQALSDEEIDAIIGYLRSKCTKSGWPRGEFNLPLAMFTEKAFPEDELVNINRL